VCTGIAEWRLHSASYGFIHDINGIASLSARAMTVLNGQHDTIKAWLSISTAFGARAQPSLPSLVRMQKAFREHSDYDDRVAPLLAPAPSTAPPAHNWIVLLTTLILRLFFLAIFFRHHDNNSDLYHG